MRRRIHRFLDELIELPSDLTVAQIEGRACIHCGDEHSAMRPVEAYSEQSAQLFECVHPQACRQPSYKQD